MYPGRVNMKEFAYHDIDYRGRLHRVDYRSTDKDGNVCYKYAQVYTPYGYDPAKPYDILYLMHGGGGSADAWIDSCAVKNMLDHTIHAGNAKPMLVVFPTFYKVAAHETKEAARQSSRFDVHFFQKELVEDLLPAVESKFHTYAETMTPAGFKATREHRAFGGFSMGSVTTWYAFIENLPYFSKFVPLSGDSWAIEQMGGETKTEETAKLLAEAPASQGFGPEDFSIWAATGTKDPANNSLTPQIEAMKAYPEVFRFSEDWSKGNLHFLLAEDKIHAYPDVCTYLYNFISYLF